MATRKNTSGSRKAVSRTAARKKASARRNLKIASTLRGLGAGEIALTLEHADVAPLVALIRKAEGVPIGAYRDPLGSRALVLATLPLAAVQPTPFQRDLSPTHTQRLARKIDEAQAFLDPLIGLRQISALISPDETLAYRILALNTEKAHNLKDRSLEVIRMGRTLATREPRAKETDFADQFESAELLTLGIIYESTPRFAGGAYGSLLRKIDRFSERTLAASLREREGFADRLRAIDAEVKTIIEALQARGFKSPYLRNYVVARINPVRFIKQKPGDPRPAMPVGQALTRMTAAARTFKLDSVSNADLAWVAVGAGAQE
jgi:ParB family transcriptional regulator, chromosome partitioning protein